MSWLQRFFNWVWSLFHKPPHKRYATRIILDDGVEPKGQYVMGKPLSNLMQRKVKLRFEDDEGTVEKVQPGSVRAVSADDSVATIAVDSSEEFVVITPAQKGTSTTGLDAAGVPNEQAFTVTADADKGAGEREISGVYSCAIVGKDATSVKFGDDEEDTPLP